MNRLKPGHRRNSRNICITVVLILSVIGSTPALAQEETTGDTGSNTVTIHVVQEGETLSDIAAQYGIPVESIRTANGLSNLADIITGQRLIVPAMSNSLPDPAERIIIAGLGDTLYALAVRSGVPAGQLGRENHIVNPASLCAGQTLRIPPADRPESTGLLRLDEGESLWHVALRHNVNVIALMVFNHIADPVTIPAGHMLAIPGEDGTGTLLPPPWVAVTLNPLPLEAGRTAALRVTTSVTGTLTLSFLSTDQTLISDGTFHQGLVAVDRWTAPGLYPLTLTLTDEAGASWTYTRQVLLLGGGYTREIIHLADDTVALLNDEAIVQGENSYIERTMTGFTPERHWDGLFMLPVTGVMTSAFGTVRTYNGASFNAFHTGVDLAAPLHTPVYAPAAGIVVDTGLLDIRGYVTIINHGWGVYSGFWHQSSILVQPGEHVVAGQQIGTVGNTGASTAAHLHWEMRVNGVHVDPMQWVRTPFP